MLRKLLTKLNKEISYKHWLAKVAGFSIIALVILALFTRILDPFYFYDAKPGVKMNNARFANPGLIKHYDYDTAIIGSSLIQNFEMDSFRTTLGWKPLKITVGGLTPYEFATLYELTMENEGIERYIINVDLKTFNSEHKFIESDKFPDYLYNSHGIDDVKYLWGYEVWTKFIPINLALSAAVFSGFSLPTKFQYATDVDRIEDWSLDFTFSEETVKKYYENNRSQQFLIANEDISDIMKSNIDNYIRTFELRSGQEFIFLFPPYSALYWYDLESKGQLDQFLEYKQYMVNQLLEYENVRVIDAQDLSDTVDLNNYIDTLHFSPEIQEDLVDYIADGSYDVSEDNIITKEERLRSNIDKFEEKYGDWLRNIN